MNELRSRAAEAYRSVHEKRSFRAQEADVFLRVNRLLKASQGTGTLSHARAIADNRRVWTAVIASMQDPGNMFHEKLKGDMISVGLAVLRETEMTDPDIGFLMTINEAIAGGLQGDAG